MMAASTFARRALMVPARQRRSAPSVVGLTSLPDRYRRVNATVRRHPSPPSTRSSCAWVEEVAALTQPDRVHWCDGSAEEYDALCQALVDAGTFERLSDAKRPNSYLARSDPGDVARVEDRTFICSSARTTPGRPTTGATRPRCATTLSGLFDGLDARPHDVRRAVLDGPARLADRRDRRPAHRLRLRRRQHADHDPHGPARSLDVLGEDGDFVPCLHSVGAPLEPTARTTCRGRATTRQVHRPLPRDARDLVLRLGLRRQRAARQEVLRAADRVGHGPRRGLAGRAHADPQAHLARGRGEVRRRRVPERVRQDEPRDARSRRSRAGRSRRSATTSRG